MAWVHRLSNINTEIKTADCANCGNIEIRFRKSWRCLPAVRESKRLAHDKITYGEVLNRPDKCEVCGVTGKKICYDHNHVTEEFRGWLCYGCNLALGYTYDNPVTLRKLADYLESR